MNDKRDQKAAAKRLVVRDRRKQGLPPKIRDPKVLARIAELLETHIPPKH